MCRCQHMPYSYVQLRADAGARLRRPQAHLLIALLHNRYGALAMDAAQAARRGLQAGRPAVVGAQCASRLLRPHLRMEEGMSSKYLLMVNATRFAQGRMSWELRDYMSERTARDLFTWW